jgi:hypothetical protein
MVPGLDNGYWVREVLSTQVRHLSNAANLQAESPWKERG